PIVKSSESASKIQLTKGGALQWTSDAIIPASVRGRRYHHPGSDESTDRASGTERTSAVAENIEENLVGADALQPESWRMIGDVVPTQQGLVLGGVVGSRQRPYLVTVPEFDPSQGPVTVSCDMRFANIRDPENVSFAILTRGTDKPSKRGT